MSLTTNFTTIFTEVYPSHSLEELESLVHSLCRDMDYLKVRSKSSCCTCELLDYPVSSSLGIDGEFKVAFTMPLQELCSYCQTKLEPFPEHYKGAGICPLDHWHPYLLTILAEEKKAFLETAIFCKKKKYEVLSDEELDTLMKETIEYSRYLRRSETNFEFSGDPVPRGLLNTMSETDEEIKGLEFELKSRALRLTSSVQSDTD